MHLRNWRHTVERSQEVADAVLASLFTPSTFGVIGQVFPRV